MREQILMEDGSVETTIYTASVWVDDENESVVQEFFDYTDAMNWVRQQQRDYLDACGEYLHYRLGWTWEQIDKEFEVGSDGHIIWTEEDEAEDEEDEAEDDDEDEAEDDDEDEAEDTPIADALRNVMCLLSTVGAVAWILTILF